MPGIDRTLNFHPLRIAVLTVSDTRTTHTDKSGDLLAERLTGAGHHLAGRAIVTDEIEAIRTHVSLWVADPQVDIVISTGGTGFAPRDVTPEAVKPMFRREMDGFRQFSTRQARPAPAATAGIWCSASSSTAATGPAR